MMSCNVVVAVVVVVGVGVVVGVVVVVAAGVVVHLLVLLLLYLFCCCSCSLTRCWLRACLHPGRRSSCCLVRVLKNKKIIIKISCFKFWENTKYKNSSTEVLFCLIFQCTLAALLFEC